ncbi:MAG: hypothetical protein ABIG69_12235 [Bacteroidota bacterium]
MDIIPDANFAIEVCKNGTPYRNATFLATESDYMMYNQTTELPYPNQILNYMTKYNNIGIVKE